MTFNNQYGHVQYLVMSFRPNNVLAIFQEFVNEIFHISFMCAWWIPSLCFPLILASMKNMRLQFCSVSIIIVCSLKWRTHLPFLGYIISDQDLQTDPVKLSTVLNWQEPWGLKAIQCFLWFAYLLIPHFLCSGGAHYSSY